MHTLLCRLSQSVSQSAALPFLSFPLPVPEEEEEEKKEEKRRERVCVAVGRLVVYFLETHSCLTDERRATYGLRGE